VSLHLLTTTEAAEILRISPRTLERLRQTGTGPLYRKIGRRVVYRESDLAGWLDDSTFSSTSAAVRGYAE